MRSLLMTVVLLLTVILIYTQVTGGANGTKERLGRSGDNISNSIRRMSP